LHGWIDTAQRYGLSALVLRSVQKVLDHPGLGTRAARIRTA
jgi:hypothetical protein